MQLLQTDTESSELSSRAVSSSSEPPFWGSIGLLINL